MKLLLILLFYWDLHSPQNNTEHFLLLPSVLLLLLLFWDFHLQNNREYFLLLAFCFCCCCSWYWDLHSQTDHRRIFPCVLVLVLVVLFLLFISSFISSPRPQQSPIAKSHSQGLASRAGLHTPCHRTMITKQAFSVCAGLKELGLICGVSYWNTSIKQLQVVAPCSLVTFWNKVKSNNWNLSKNGSKTWWFIVIFPIIKIKMSVAPLNSVTILGIFSSQIFLLENIS